MNGNLHRLNWIYEADEPIKYTVIESGPDGIHFNEVSRVAADARQFSCKPPTDATTYYRIKVIRAANDQATYSNIITLRMARNARVNVMSHLVSSSIIINADMNYAYQLLDESGRLLQKGKLISGANRVDLTTLKKGLLLLHIIGGNEAYTEKLMRQ